MLASILVITQYENRVYQIWFVKFERNDTRQSSLTDVPGARVDRIFRQIRGPVIVVWFAGKRVCPWVLREQIYG